MRHIVNLLTVRRLILWIICMLAIVLTDQRIFGVYHYYNPGGETRFVIATLISSCAVMFLERVID